MVSQVSKIVDGHDRLTKKLKEAESRNAELVEALEKAQQYAKERDAENQDLMLTVGRLRVEREGQESRTVKIPGWFVKDAIAVYDRDEIEEALSAAGIKWEAE